jgi:branched-chain amino acid aminotransferase
MATGAAAATYTVGGPSAAIEYPLSPSYGERVRVRGGGIRKSQRKLPPLIPTSSPLTGRRRTISNGETSNMAERSNVRVAWFNGKFVPESEVRIPFRDLSWVYGDGCFDMTRSFHHKLFKVQEHVDRLYRSLKYLRIDPGFGPERMVALTEELFERNRHLLGPDDDYWVGQRISRGVKDVPGDNLDYHGPNVVLECAPLPLVQRAKLFKEGIRVIVPSHRRTPPESLTPRAKTHNYLNMIVANQEVQSADPEAWAVLLDTNGNLAEGMGSNIFTVRNGAVLTPREKFVLPGVSRQTVIDLARQEGIPVAEADIDLYDSYVADEMFLTSTSLCICPVTKINGVDIGPKGQVWGPVTKRLADAYSRYVGYDFVGQYLKRYQEGMQARAF